MAFHLLESLNLYSDIELEIIVLNKGILFDKLNSKGIKTYLLNENKLNFLNIVVDVRKILHRTKPDIIHSHRYKENIISCLSRGFSSRMKLIATQHGLSEKFDDSVDLKNQFVLKLNLWFLKNFFSKIISVSRRMKGKLKAFYRINGEMIEIIHNGIDINHVKEKKRAANKFFIGSAGRFFPVKDYPLMVKIAGIIKKETDGIKFKIAGDGPEFNNVCDCIKELNLLDSFQLAGHVNNIQSFYSNIDLYLNTSIYEGLPMSVLEAMSMGLPVIAPDTGGLGEIIKNGVNGFLISSREPEKFAEKCILLFKNNQLYKNMSQEAYRTVKQNFTRSAMAEKYYSLYKRVLTIPAR